MNSVRSNRTHKNNKILKNSDLLFGLIGLIRFDSVRYSRKDLEFHCMFIIKFLVKFEKLKISSIKKRLVKFATWNEFKKIIMIKYAILLFMFKPINN
jgi:hypothetical protein